MMVTLKLKRFIKLCIIFLLICGMESVITVNSASADIGVRTHWPVKVASNWNSVYGRVSNLILQDGDSVGMFDSKGNCYGAGLIKGAYYFLSAYMLEEANPAIPGDFAIPGFKKGDTVIFKAYKEGTGEEYILTPTNGVPYTYTNKGKYPPVRIDLIYAKDGPLNELEGRDDLQDIDMMLANLDEIDPGDPDKLLAELEEGGLEEADGIQELPEVPEEIEEEIIHKDKEGIGRRSDVRERFDVDSYRRYEATDYEGEEFSNIKKPSRHTVDRPSKYIARADTPASSEYTSGHKEGNKETIAAEGTVVAEALYAETAQAEKKPVKKILPLIPIVILICGSPALIAVLIKMLRRM